MGRLGILIDNYHSILQKLGKSKSIYVEAVYSHFASSEEKDTEYRDLQLDRFQEIVKLSNDIFLNEKLFNKIEFVYMNKDNFRMQFKNKNSCFIKL